MRTTKYPIVTGERSDPRTTGPVAPAVTKTIPFDYVFEFKLKGKDPSRQEVVKLQDVVEISMQGVFVAVALGYSFVLDQSTVREIPIDNEPALNTPVIVRATFPGEGPNQPPLILRIAGTPNSDVTLLLFTESVKQRFVFGEPSRFQDLTVPLQPGERDSVHLESNGTAEIDFLNEVNIGGVLRVWDRTNNIIGEPLQFAVVGPDPSTGLLPGVGDKTVNIYGFPTRNVGVLIFDGRTGATFQVTDVEGRTEFSFNDKGWTRVPLLASATTGGPAIERSLSPGDVLLVTPIFEPNRFGVPSVFAVPSRRASDLSVGTLLKGFSDVNAGALRPSARFANTLRANPPIGNLSRDVLSRAFEATAGTEDISFLYSIDIVSSGRELQNKPIHNIAGLGIANGDRPFRPFAQPFAFEPRSVIRIQVEELSTLPGTLYIVLQGYKTLGTGRRPE